MTGLRRLVAPTALVATVGLLAGCGVITSYRTEGSYFGDGSAEVSTWMSPEAGNEPETWALVDDEVVGSGGLGREDEVAPSVAFHGPDGSALTIDLTGEQTDPNEPPVAGGIDVDRWSMTLVRSVAEQAYWTQDSGCATLVTELNTSRFVGSIDCGDVPPEGGDPDQRLSVAFEVGNSGSP